MTKRPQLPQPYYDVTILATVYCENIYRFIQHMLHTGCEDDLPTHNYRILTYSLLSGSFFVFPSPPMHHCIMSVSVQAVRAAPAAGTALHVTFLITPPIHTIYVA